jgi:hypothetical protein
MKRRMLQNDTVFFHVTRNFEYSGVTFTKFYVLYLKPHKFLDVLSHIQGSDGSEFALFGLVSPPP